MRTLFKVGRLCVWGESAIPHFVAIFWFLERFSAERITEDFLTVPLSLICNLNKQGSSVPLADPYKSFDEIFAEDLSKLSKIQKEPRKLACNSYAMEPLILLLSRRLRRQYLAGIWSEATKVEMVEFRPKAACDLLLWHSESGVEKNSWLARPQSWAALKKQAASRSKRALPKVIQHDPIFGLMFLLVYPHRTSTDLIKFLDWKLS